MRILYFHQHFSTPHGSTGTRSYEMAKALIAHGHTVTIICGSGFMAHTGLSGLPRNGVRKGYVDGIEVVEICLPYSNHDSLSKRAKTFLQFAFKSIQIALKSDYDILFATSTPLTTGIPGIIMRLLKPQKIFIFEVRDLWPELPKAMGVVKNPFILAGLSILERLCYLSMHAGIALSPGIRTGMKRRANKNKEIIMIPNGCDLKLFRPGVKNDNIDKNVIPISSKGLRCIFTGAHGIANGLDAVLDAAVVLKRKGRSDIQLIFIGDGKLKPRLQKRVKTEGLDNSVFLDPMPKMQLANLLADMDVGMMILENVPAFYYGTSPNKFFDYISSGLPVLINYPGWLNKIVQANKCGKTIAPGNPSAFADALEEFADRKGEMSQMGKNSRKLAEMKFDRIELSEQFVDFLEQTYLSVN